MKLIGLKILMGMLITRSADTLSPSDGERDGVRTPRIFCAQCAPEPERGHPGRSGLAWCDVLRSRALLSSRACCGQDGRAPGFMGRGIRLILRATENDKPASLT